MILESRKLFFNTILVVLEDDKLMGAVKSGKYSAITGISYNKLSLPDFRIRSKPTTVISLKESEEEIFGRFSDVTRNKINRTYRDEGFKFVVDDKDFDAAHSLYSDFEYLHGVVPFSEEALKKCTIFSAYYNDEIVSGIFVDLAKPYLRVRYIFSKRLITDDKDLYNKISWASRRVMWEICLWGKKNGYISLDLAYINFENPKLAGIREYKMSFGGDVVYDYTYIYKSFLFGIFEKLVYFKIAALRFKYFIRTILHGKQG